MDEAAEELGVAVGGGAGDGVRLALVPEDGPRLGPFLRRDEGGLEPGIAFAARGPVGDRGGPDAYRDEADGYVVALGEEVAEQWPRGAARAGGARLRILAGLPAAGREVEGGDAFVGGLLGGLAVVRRVGLAAGDEDLADADPFDRGLGDDGPVAPGAELEVVPAGGEIDRFAGLGPVAGDPTVLAVEHPDFDLGPVDAGRG